LKNGGLIMNKNIGTTITLLQLLSKNLWVNSKIVKEELEVSMRTAQRYLDELSLKHFIKQEKIEGGKGFRYSFKGGLKINKYALQENETSFLMALFELGLNF